ncbi:MFS transporter [Kitasatospora viridis]|uniref:MFS transporter n=1 Tax=Kitasatospora viridis TaxID=281105 RepID=A0A561UA59_9ACTN|nr:MFS transporter [Kitasatospora viridis]TWF96244.1 MFS transporter [Kitasatospora viridis]
MRVLMDVEPLRQREFRRLLGARTVTSLGAQLTAVTVPLQIYQRTGSSAAVGLAGLVGLVPMVLAALWGGAVADRVDRRRMLLVTNGGIGLTSVLLALQQSVGVLLLLVAVQQAFFGANAAVGGAVTPRLVPAPLLPAANTLQSTVDWSAGIAGPLLAGALLPVLGARTLYLADAVAMGATLWAVRCLPALPALPTHPVAGSARTPRPGVRAGLRVLVRDRVLLVTYLADFAALFLGLPSALFPQLAAARWGLGQVGVLYAAVPVGGVLAGLFSGSFTRIRRPGLAITGAVCAWGGAIAAFAFARPLALAAGLLAVAGGALIVLSAFRKAVLQTVVTDDLRGRLQGADTVVAAGGPRLAGFAHGAAAAVVGPVWAVAGGGLAAVAVMLLLVLACPAFRRHRSPTPTTPTTSNTSAAPAAPASPAAPAASR